MFGPMHRLLLPCLYQHENSWCNSSSSCSSSQHSGHQGVVEQRCQLHKQPDAARPLPPLPPVSQLTTEQKQELKQAAVDSFKQDPQAASRLLAKNLSDDAKRHLLAALECSKAPPDLSRAAMVDTPENSIDHASTTAAATAEADNGHSSAAQEVPEPTFQQLLRVGVTKGIPFVAFGFFDNIIMITAGEQIDLMFGAKLGLSSMAAAGLGNTVADVVGINISHTIEHKFKDMKSMAPALTKAQLALPRTQRAKWLGCAIGMASGCLLGLTPLLFFDGSQGEGSISSSRNSSSSSSSGGEQPAMAT